MFIVLLKHNDPAHPTSAATRHLVGWSVWLCLYYSNTVSYEVTSYDGTNESVATDIAFIENDAEFDWDNGLILTITHISFGFLTLH